MPAFESALDRLAGRDVARVYPGHGPVHGRYDEVLAQSRASLRSLLSGVRGLLADGVETAAAVARERAGERRAFGYLLPEVVSALAHLEATGRAAARVDDDVRRYRPA